MGTHSTKGFTIIETMLVLAITGLLVSTLFVGIGGTINNQRYKDSVTSFKATLQQQFTFAINATNVSDVSSKWTCSNAAIVTEVNAPSAAGGITAPGQSDCVILGQYTSVVNDKIASVSIIGKKTGTTTGLDDVADLKTNYVFGIAQNSIETSTLEWGASITWPTGPSGGIDAKTSGDTSSRSIGILTVRSPQSGTVYTFTDDAVADAIQNTTSAQLSNMMFVNNSVPGQKQRIICIDPSAGSASLTVPEKLSISIAQGASDSTGIEQRSDTINSSLGQASSCN